MPNEQGVMPRMPSVARALNEPPIAPMGASALIPHCLGTDTIVGAFVTLTEPSGASTEKVMLMSALAPGVGSETLALKWGSKLVASAGLSLRAKMSSIAARATISSGVALMKENRMLTLPFGSSRYELAKRKRDPLGGGAALSGYRPFYITAGVC